MADKPIIFSAPMVRALLAGQKTQTRRLLRNPEYYGCPTGDCPHQTQAECNAAMAALASEIVPYAPGDRLYVREHWKTSRGNDGVAPRDLDPLAPVLYLADGTERGKYSVGTPGKHRQGMHMPRWASRLWLSVTDVRVQRLQDISEADCLAEGVEEPGFWDQVAAGQPWHPRGAYRDLWNSLHTDPGTRWDDNPWIVAVSFTVHHGNIDEAGHD